MKVTLNLNSEGNGNCLVEREPGDPRFYGIKNAAGESRLLYHVKQALAKQGYDFVKKRMWKDEYLVSEMQQYLRERKDRNGRCLAIYNDMWAVLGAEEYLNVDGRVTFAVRNIGKETTNETI